MTTSTPEPEAPVDPDPVPTASNDALHTLASLRRSRSDKKIAGVAGGISRHLDIDPVIIRVTLVVLVFFGGAGVILYVACWLLVPLEGSAAATVRLDERNRGVALALVSVIAVLALLGDSLGGWGFPWQLAVAGGIVALVMLYRGRQDRQDRQGAPPEPSPTYAPPHTASPYTAAPHIPPYTPAATPERARRGGPLLFWYAVALIAIGVGVLGTFDLAGVDVAASAYPVLALTISAVLLVAGAFWGRPGGLILLGLVSAVATAGVVVLGELEVDRLSPTPLDSSELRSDYDLDIGELDLNLNEVRDLEALDGRRIDLEVGLGRIEVLVPAGLDVTVVSDLGAGDSSVFGVESSEGTKTDSLDGGADVPTLTLYATVGLGEIEIAREESR